MPPPCAASLTPRDAPPFPFAMAVPRTFIMLSPSLPAAPRALTCHLCAAGYARALPCRSLSPPAMPACRPVTPSRRYCMPHVPPCYSLPPLATPRALPSQPHLFKLATVPADQQGASRPESLSDADPLRVQMPPRPSSTAIQSPALCFHPRQDHPPTPRIRVPRSLSMHRAKQIRDFSLCSSPCGARAAHLGRRDHIFASAEGSKLGGGPTSAAERTRRESSSQQTAFPSVVDWQIPREKKARAPHAVPPLHLRPRVLTPRPPGQMPFTSAGSHRRLRPQDTLLFPEPISPPNHFSIICNAMVEREFATDHYVAPFIRRQPELGLAGSKRPLPSLNFDPRTLVSSTAG
ncbi:hypothetical protein EDB84DRAFT_1567929 [Lactarius hengduanensis]|nr:hypothetical protein EDB84DRAFT_1567929 [Lactarius hengduanensis]